MGVIYLDTSCLLKLLLEEPESEAVRLAVARESEVTVSALTELETALQLRAGWLAGEYRERRDRAYVGRVNAFRETDPFLFSDTGWFAVSDGAAPGSRSAQSSLPNARSASPRSHGGTGIAAHLMPTDTAQAAGAKARGLEVLSPGRR